MEREDGEGPFKVYYFCRDNGELVHIEHYSSRCYLEEVQNEADTYAYGYTYKIEKY